MLNENFWNTSPDKLSSRLSKFSSHAYTFKKSPRDFEKVASNERIDNFQRNMKNLLKAKRESSERHSARKLERLIV